MKVTFELTILFLCCSIWGINSSKILVIFPMAAPSHYILGSSLAKELAERGHDVTIVSAFEEKNRPKNGTYREIVLTGYVEQFREQMKQMGGNMFDMAGGNPFIGITFMVVSMSPFIEFSIKHPNFQKLINSGEKFDAVIVEQFMNDAQKALAAHFDAPLILFSTVGANNWFNPLIGNPSPPSYISDVSLNYAPPLTFFQRVYNTLFINYLGLLFNFYFYPYQERVMKEYINKDLNFYDILYNSSIVLVNSHQSYTQAVPMVPNMIDIGGYHIKPPKKLPADLQSFLDSAKEGVVYFSMGSNLKSADLPVAKRDAILKVFSKLKQKVLWKWEEDQLPNQPSNVKIGKWLPQQDILAHPNVKVFITHGGLLSTTEASYHGVPLVAIPIFGDQKLNAENAVSRGVAVSLSYPELSEDKLGKALDEVLNNPKYLQNAKQAAKLFHDRQTKPMDTAVYWVEYVIRHRGAPHLRVSGLDLPLCQYLLLDVFGFLAVIVIIGLYIKYLVLKYICCKLFKCNKCGSKAKEEEKKKN